jgi:uncharacterized C2H2 Zn-finger protein
MNANQLRNSNSNLNHSTILSSVSDSPRSDYISHQLITKKNLNRTSNHRPRTRRVSPQVHFDPEQLNPVYQQVDPVYPQVDPVYPQVHSQVHSEVDPQVHSQVDPVYEDVLKADLENSDDFELNAGKKNLIYQLICPFCESKPKFKTMDGLIAHVRKKHNQNLRNQLSYHGFHKFKCNFCDASFLNERDLIRHVNTKHPHRGFSDNDHECTKCGIRSHISLRKHKRLPHDHPIPYIPHYGHKVCMYHPEGHYWQNPSGGVQKFINHQINNHVINYPFKCNFCFLKFGTDAERNTHEILIHADKVPIQTPQSAISAKHTRVNTKTRKLRKLPMTMEEKAARREAKREANARARAAAQAAAQDAAQAAAQVADARAVRNAQKAAARALRFAAEDEDLREKHRDPVGWKARKDREAQEAQDSARGREAVMEFGDIGWLDD